MTEELIIRDFGPIRQARISVRPLTVFVGPQATGKSLAALLLCFMRGIETLSTRPPETFLDRTRSRVAGETGQAIPEADLPLADSVSGLEWWFGNEAAVYTVPGTVLSWNPEAPSSDVLDEIKWDEQGAHLNQHLEARVRRRSGSLRAQFYIPAGRALYSFFSPGLAVGLISSRRARWPGYIAHFYETLAGAIKELWQRQEPRQHSLFEAMTMTDYPLVEQRAAAILKGRIRYGPDAILLDIEKQRLRPETIAAGQMEFWPFWTILQVTPKPEISATRIYFEEPEAHLHPGAQRSVVEIIAHLVRQGGQFVLTTHSPYILYAINNCLMAQAVLDAGRQLPPDVPAEVALRGEQVAAYRFSEDGQVHDIMDAETGLIDADELEQVASELGASFTDMQARLEGAE